MKRQFGMIAIAGMLIAAAAEHAQTGTDLGHGRAIVTVLPAHPSDPPVNISALQIKAEVNGKDATVTDWKPLRGADGRVELVMLIDSSARTSLGEQFGSITDFVKEMPSNTKMALAYMEDGQAVLAGPLSSDPAKTIQELHFPPGTAGSSGSPYFCLSDLAKHWPSQDTGARRVVVMVTDGVDNYLPHYDPEDPYVKAAITDSVRAGFVVYTLYWHSEGRMDSTGWATDAGQSLLLQLAQETGGYNYWLGFGNPVSFDPYFQDLRIRLRNQYLLTFSAPPRGKSDAEPLKIKAEVREAKIDSPKQVWVDYE